MGKYTAKCNDCRTLFLHDGESAPTTCPNPNCGGTNVDYIQES